MELVQYAGILNGSVLGKETMKGDEMNMQQLIDEAVSLPVEERVLVIDSLLRSLNQPESELDKEWAAAANRRLLELRAGSVDAVPGKEMFERMWKRFDK
jgi:putative addiction module component (TIGR02574 family)